MVLSLLIDCGLSLLVYLSLLWWIVSLVVLVWLACLVDFIDCFTVRLWLVGVFVV